MIWSIKFDLFDSQAIESEFNKGLLLDTDFELVQSELIEFELMPDSFEFFAPAISDPVSASGTGTASASFSGFASGSGSSSISVSASAFVAPDGSSGAFLDVSTSGDTVGGVGSVQAGADFDVFVFETPAFEPLDLPVIDMAAFDLDPQIELDFSSIDLGIWL